MAITLDGTTCSQCRRINSFVGGSTSELTCEYCGKEYDPTVDTDRSILGCIAFLIILTSLALIIFG